MTEWLGNFHLLRPYGLLCGLPLAFLVWRFWSAPTSISAWARACDPQLLNHLISSSESSSRLPGVLLVVAGILLTLAIAGPSWEQIPQPVWRAPAARVIVMDLSQSMAAADLQPDRLSRARFAAADLLDAQAEGETGLVVFAGSAFAVVPLTADRGTLKHMLNSLSTDLMPIQGGRLSTGLLQAASLFENASKTHGEIYVFTDSRPDAAAYELAAESASRGFPVHVVAIGTTKGAPIPGPDGGWISASDGSIVLATLEADELRRLAQTGGGRFALLAPTGLDQNMLTATSGAPVDATRAAENFQADLWRDEAPLLALLLAPLAALGFRRGWLSMTALCAVLVTPPPAQALEWSAWWQRPDQRAYQLLQQDRAEDAAAGFQDPQWRGSAHFRARDFAAAARDFGQGATAIDHYNRGNALARAGQLDQALAAYDEALQLNPELEDAQFNRQLVEQLMQEQSQDADSSDEAQSGDPGEDGDPSESGESRQAGESSPSDAASGESSEPSEPGEAAEDGQAADGQAGEESDAQTAEADAAETGTPEDQSAAAQAATEQDARDQEAEIAVEQWLRRIPDDPGGLLRRKFLLEQRAREPQTQGGQAW